MRYFQTSNASRPYHTGGLTFVFEPVGQIGGTWLGVLSVDDESAGSALAGAAFPQVKELTLEEYDAVKKKPQSKPSSFIASPQQQAPAPVSVPAPAAPSVATDKPASVVLPEPKTARVDPPNELARVETVKAIKPATSR